MILACGNHKVLGLFLLQDEPHTLNIVFGIAPVAQRVEVAKIKLVLESLGDAGHGEGNLACDEVLATAFTLVVEQYAVTAVHPVAFAVVLHYPEAVQLGHTVRAARIERRGLFLRHLLNEAVKLARRRLIDAALVGKSRYTHRLEQPQHSHCIGIGRKLRHIETDFDVALGRKVVYLVGADLADNPDERRAIGHITPVEVDKAFLLHITHPFVQIQMLDAPCVERRAATQYAVHFVSFFYQKLSQKASVLAGNTGNQCHFCHRKKCIVLYVCYSISSRNHVAPAFVLSISYDYLT